MDRRPTFSPIEDATSLVCAARGGDPLAWHKLIDNYSGMLVARARSFRLSREDTQDVVQTTWLRAMEHIHQLKDDERLASWLTTIVSREALRTIGQRRREVSTNDTDLLDRPEPHARRPEQEIARRQLSKIVANLVADLPPSHRVVFEALAGPKSAYADIASATGRPMGSIGPTRARCLKRLRAQLQERDIGADFLD
jgi:RNA polymerase sigma factor (sigma-70 family)